MKNIYNFIKIIILCLFWDIACFSISYSQGLDSTDYSRLKILKDIKNNKKFLKNKASTNPKDFYPLQVGNYWEYECYEPASGRLDFKQYYRIIGDTIIINKYYIIECISIFTRRPWWPDSIPTPVVKDIYYKRKDDSNNIYLYNKYRKCDRIADRFSAKLGEVYLSWKYYDDRCDTSFRYGIIIDTGIYNSISWKYILQTDRPAPTSSLFYSKEYFYEGIGPVSVKKEYTYYYLIGAIIDKDTLGMITDVPIIKNEITKEFELYQNYPNPFNPSTRIRYQIYQNAKIRLTIYDMVGKVVNILVSKDEKPGDYDIEWNGKNFSGINVSSGIYFYRLTVFPLSRDPPFIQTHKMLLIR